MRLQWGVAGGLLCSVLGISTPCAADSILRIPLPYPGGFAAFDAKVVGPNLIVPGNGYAQGLLGAVTFSISQFAGAFTQIPLQLTPGADNNDRNGAGMIGVSGNDFIISGGVVAAGDVDQAVIWNSSGTLIQQPKFFNDPTWAGYSSSGLAADRYMVVNKPGSLPFDLGTIYFEREVLVGADGAQYDFPALQNSQFPQLGPFNNSVYGASTTGNKLRFVGVVLGEITAFDPVVHVYHELSESAVWEFDLNTKQFTRFEHQPNVQGYSNVIWDAISPSGRTILGHQAQSALGEGMVLGHAIVCDFERTSCRSVDLSPYQGLNLNAFPLVFDGPNGPVIVAALFGGPGNSEEWFYWSPSTGLQTFKQYVFSKTGIQLPFVDNVAGSSIDQNGNAILFVTGGVVIDGDNFYLVFNCVSTFMY